MSQNKYETRYAAPSDTDMSIQWNNRDIEPAVTPDVKRLYAQHATELKVKMDRVGAEVVQRHDKMRLINDLIAEINNITDEKNSIDLTKHPKIQEQLRVAKELGVKVVEDKLEYTPIQRDRLIENLHLTADGWDKENRNQTQKMEIFIKEFDRLMILLKETDKKEDQAKRPMLSGMRGGG